MIVEHLGVEFSIVSTAIDESGSLIATFDRFLTSRVRPYETPNISDVEKWLADNEVLDPEGPGEMFEPFARRGLLRRFLHRK